MEIVKSNPTALFFVIWKIEPDRKTIVQVVPEGPGQTEEILTAQFPDPDYEIQNYYTNAPEELRAEIGVSRSLGYDDMDTES